MISGVQKNYATVIIGAVLSFFANNSRCTLHQNPRVDIQLMCHLVCRAVMVIHLGIHIVKSSCLYLNGPVTVLKSAWSVLLLPVLNCASTYCLETNAVYVEKYMVRDGRKIRCARHRLTSLSMSLWCRHVIRFNSLQFKARAWEKSSTLLISQAAWILNVIKCQTDHGRETDKRHKLGSI